MAAEQENRREMLATQFVAALPHATDLGMQVETVGEAEASVTMPYDKRLIGDPETGVIHGGAISALMDTCSGVAVLAHPDQFLSTATLDLRIDYMRGATPGQKITAQAHCYHVTRTVAFIRATATDDDTERPVATATGAFTIQRQQTGAKS